MLEHTHGTLNEALKLAVKWDLVRPPASITGTVVLSHPEDAEFSSLASST